MSIDVEKLRQITEAAQKELLEKKLAEDKKKEDQMAAREESRFQLILDLAPAIMEGAARAGEGRARLDVGIGDREYRKSFLRVAEKLRIYYANQHLTTELHISEVSMGDESHTEKLVSIDVIWKASVK